MLPKILTRASPMDTFVALYLACLGSVYLSGCDAQSGQLYSWECHPTKSTCSRVLTVQSDNPLDFMECKMICSDVGILWPLPKTIAHLSKSLVTFGQIQDISIAKCNCLSSANAHINQFFDEVFKGSYLPSLRVVSPNSSSSKADVETISIKILIQDELSALSLDTDESYTLEIAPALNSDVTISIGAITYFGARHALETLSQLITWSRVTQNFQMHDEVNISDQPYFRHRGLSLDTARQYVPMKYLKKVVEGLSFNKLNTLHWHLSDSQSFNLLLPSYPQLAQYGAYFPEQVYTVEDIRDLVEFATLRGIRIVPEVDGPRHAANGWQFGETEGLGKLAFCINADEERCRGGVCGLLNPLNSHVYDILEGVFSDLKELIPSDHFHLGADEVVFNCWNKSEEIQSWFTDQGLSGTLDDYYTLWGMYQTNTFERLTRANQGQKMKATVWTSSLTRRGNAAQILAPEDYIIQIWSNHNDTEWVQLMDAGYEIIASFEDIYYLGCGQGSWGDKAPAHCDPFKQWRDIYDFDPADSYLESPDSQPERLSQILGAEIAMWIEQTYGPTLEAQVFPRAAALAERVWTKPAGNWTEAEVRFIHQRERIVERGVIAEAVQMYWCHQNEGRCRVFGDAGVPEPES